MPSLALAALLLLGPAAARADDVEPPPTDCPAGTRGRASHAGPHCEVVPCESPCPPGLSCVEHGYCIETVPCGGLRPETDECTVDVVVGECDAAGACARGSCTRHRVCLGASAPPPSAPPPPASTTPASTPSASSEPSGCHAAPGRAGPNLLALVSLLLVASRRARPSAP